MQLYYIRHAQSVNNARWVKTRSSEEREPDPGLTEAGHQQAQLLAEYLAYRERDVATEEDNHNRQGFDITHLYSSLMVRSVTTGHYISELLDLPLLGLEVVHEIGGIYETDRDTGERIGLPGASSTDFKEAFPRLKWPEGADEKGWWRSRAAEEWETVPGRAQDFLKFLQKQHGNSDDRVAVVSHAGFFHALMHVLLSYERFNDRLDEVREIGFLVNNSSVSRFDFEEDRIRISYLNRVDHLPPELIT